MKKTLAILSALIGMGALAFSLFSPVRAYADVIDPGNPGGPLSCCPTDNNACNNDDGCDSSLQDQGFWTHWIGMRRGETSCNTEWLDCKDRYSEVTTNGHCTKGDFQKTFQEKGCTHG